jgi:ABC-2 type transport system ATP-binding protein
LAIQDLCKRFGRIQAVDHLSMDVQPGQMAGFLGPNGAGKSTTLTMIARLVRPTSGQVRLFGVDVAQEFKRAIRSTGFMIEAPAFYGHLSARKNLELAARLRSEASQRDIDQALQHVGLSDRQRDKVRTYSQGMRQRLGIALAMLGGPRLLVLDEPTNGMDPEGTREILGLLRDKVDRDGLTVFMSSHLLHEVEEYCDTVFVINQGRLVASGPVRDILAPRLPVVTVTFAGDVPPVQRLLDEAPVTHVESVGRDTLEVTLAAVGDVAWLNQFLVTAGFRVSALAPRRTTLKEFFLSITGDHHG